MTRPASALKGSEFVQVLPATATQARDNAIYEAIAAGNTPYFMRTLKTITHTEMCKDGKEHTIELQVTPDYLSVGYGGGDEVPANFVRTPLFPGTAQKVADLCGTLLPSRKIVNLIYKYADEKIAPSFMPSDKTMTMTSAFLEHNRKIELLRKSELGSLVAGHKKDICITNGLYSDFKNESTYKRRVAIYGWFLNGKPIQGLNATSHDEHYVDYSHGVRLVALDCKVDGRNCDLVDIYRNPVLSLLISDEGPVLHPHYPHTP